MVRRVFATCGVVLAAAVVATGCGQFGKADTGDSETTATSSADRRDLVTTAKFTDAERKKDGCGKVQNLANQGREHVEGDVDYEQNPPTSGDHNAVPLDWGVYDEQQPTEKWVHNLEHGHVVVLYKGISEEEKRELLGHVEKDDFHVVVLPREANPKDGVYYVAWDHRIYCEQPSAAAFQLMLNDYRDQAPELLMQDKRKTDDD